MENAQQNQLDEQAAFEAEMAKAMAEEAALAAGREQVPVAAAQFPPIGTSSSAPEKDRKFDMLMDLTLPVSIELGRTNLLIRDILAFERGSVVELDKLASEPVDILINGKKMAEGEVVVIEKHFGIRITSLVDAAERIKGLGK